ncbi:hypothetical protein [Paenibacillus ferrarius]|uniref:hypothetical protein n=1 Tax=Paenibacillus ferrarius TaxID=1469647 RepID=UPI003D28B163
MKRRIAALALAAILITPGPSRTYADSDTQDPMPYVTLIDSFKLYASQDTTPGKVIGALSPLQSVQISRSYGDNLMGLVSADKLPVETWLGTAWINLKEGSYKLGKLTSKEQTITLLDAETPLWDAPRGASAYALSPQQVQAIASIPDCDPYTPCRNTNSWFLIHTSWLGDKWVRPFSYAEKYQGVPVEGSVPINSERPVYQYPFEQPLTGEPKIEAGLLKPLAKYTYQEGMVPPSIWYKVQTSLGERWVPQDSRYGLGVENVEPSTKGVDMPVPFHAFDGPFVYGYNADTEEAFQPQRLQTIGQISDWYFFIDSNGNGKWVSPAMEIASQLTGELAHDAKLGVKEELVRIELTETSVAINQPYIPLNWDPRNIQGSMTFSPQTVTASRSWASPSGETWYYVHTWQGPKWVRL